MDRCTASWKIEGYESSSHNRFVYLTTRLIGHPVEVHVKNGLLIYIVIFHATNAEKGFGIILKMALGKRWYFGNVTKPTSTSSPQLVLTDAISPNLSPHRFFRCHDRSPTCSTKSHHGRNKLVAVTSPFLYTETAPTATRAALLHARTMEPVAATLLFAEPNPAPAYVSSLHLEDQRPVHATVSSNLHE